MPRNLLEALEDTVAYRRLKLGLNQGLIQFFGQEVARDRRGLKVLELACGSGYGAHLLAAEPWVRLSVAQDISRLLYDQAAQNDFAAAFVQGDLFAAPFAPASFDLVWNSSALEHLPDPPAALAAMVEMTKPGGQVFVGVPYLAGPLALYYLAPTPGLRQWLGRPYRRRELESMFASCGLEPQAGLVYFLRMFVGLLGRKPR